MWKPKIWNTFLGIALDCTTVQQMSGVDVLQGGILVAQVFLEPGLPHMLELLLTQGMCLLCAIRTNPEAVDCQVNHTLADVGGCRSGPARGAGAGSVRWGARVRQLPRPRSGED